MKKLIHKYGALVIFFLSAGLITLAQDSTEREMVVGIDYYMPGNKIPYLKISVKEKVERSFFPLKDISASVYIQEESNENLLGTVKTNAKGEGKIFISSAFKSQWDSAGTITFLAITEVNKDFASAQNEIEITKAKIEIDTTSDEETKNVMVRVLEWKEGEWRPAPEVEVKIGIKRLLGNLAIDEEGLFTTDSSGEVMAEFLKDSLPGDSEGNIMLIARTDDNEFYGNISVEKKVPWGIVPPKNDFFGKRSLWATRDKSPIWLLILAYSIVGGVWSTLLYLFYQLFKIRRLGRMTR